MKFSQVKNQLASLAAWETKAEEMQFIGACFEYIGPIGKQPDKLFKLLNSGVTSEWFLNERHQALFEAIEFYAPEVGQPGTIVKPPAIYQRAEEIYGESNWAQRVSQDCSEATYAFRIDDFIKDDIPVWRTKLKKPRVLCLLGKLKEILDKPPSIETSSETESVLFKIQNEWEKDTLPLSEEEDKVFESVRDQVLKPRPPDQFVSSGIKAIDYMLGGGFGGPGSPEEGKLIVVMARPGQGKALRNSEPVLMSDGSWKAISEINIGDSVATPRGKSASVCGVFPQGIKQLYRVAFTDGRYVDCCGEHLWSVECSKWFNPSARSFNKKRVVSTLELIEYLKSKRYKRKIWLDRVSGEFGLQNKLNFPSWLIGFLIGDGALSGNAISFSTADEEILEKVKSCMDKNLNIVHTSKYDYLITSGRSQKEENTNILLLKMRALGLMGKRSEDKFIPDYFFSLCREERLNLLRGLMDADGYNESSGGQAKFTTVSSRLAEDTRRLVFSLGGRATIRTKQTFYTYKNEKKAGQLAYVVNIRLGDNPFSLERKARESRQKQINQRICIESITKIDSDYATCISVRDQDHQFITRDYIPAHNTQMALNIAMRVGMAGYKVGFWELEMQRKQLALRMMAAYDHELCRKAGHRSAVKLTYEMLRTHRIQGEVRERYIKTDFSVLQENIKMFYDSSLSHDKLSNQMRLFCRRFPDTRLFAIDHIGLMQGANEFSTLGEITRVLKLTATELGIDVMLLSQLNRGVEGRTDKMPTMSDARGSGRIEEDADVILGLLRPYYYNPNDDPTLFQIGGLKNRQGATGVFDASIELNCCAIFDREESVTTPLIPLPSPADDREGKTNETVF